MTRQVRVGKASIGGGQPILVQSMTNTKTTDVRATVAQINQLEAAGCELVRVAVPDRASARGLKDIKAQTGIPIIADVHYRPTVALAVLEEGADKIRINPGTIRDRKEVEAIVGAAKERGVAVRIGVNSGSLAAGYRGGGSGSSSVLVDSVLDYVELCEALDFRDLVLSVKSSSVRDTVVAYQELSKKTDYPLHVGVTEAGTLISGAVKSSVGLGILLSQGIGDTIRVSLTAPPIEEVRVAYKILSALGLRKEVPELISCPTCGRSTIDLVAVAEEVEAKLEALKMPLRVAVMGCEVNGPGEAREADVGIAWGKERGLLFKKGEIVRKLNLEQLVPALIKEVEKAARDGRDRRANGEEKGRRKHGRETH